MSIPDFLVHHATDSVGVVTVETVQAGQTLTGWVMDADRTITVAALEAIPLGHKVALADIADGDTVLKYGQDIGRAVAPIRRGGHVHVHNLKTKRW
jgi:(2R)-sulfolactate sulfo-lyase subunit alpha